MMASTVERSCCTSARASGDVIHWLVPSSAAERPSNVAANFQMTYGRGSPAAARRVAVSQPTLPAYASADRRPISTSTPASAQLLRPAPGDRVGVGHGGHDAHDAGRDEGLAARAGPAGVVARLERHDGGPAAGPLAGGGQRPHLGVRPAGVRVEALADDLAGGVEDDAAHHRVRAGRAQAVGGERDGAPHRPVLDGRPAVPVRHAPRSSSRRVAA